jgi:hypothetical protein
VSLDGNTSDKKGSSQARALCRRWSLTISLITLMIAVGVQVSEEAITIIFAWNTLTVLTIASLKRLQALVDTLTW